MKNTIKQLIDNVKIRENKNNNFLHLTVNENQISKTANSFLGSKISERYYFGGGEDGVVDFYPFTFVGMPEVENLINSASTALKKMSGGSVVNMDFLSGLHAMMSAILSTTEPGDTVMTVNPKDGGHFATTGILKHFGRKHIFASYDMATLQFDAEATAKTFKKNKAKMFYIEASNYVNPHNLKEIRKKLGKDAIIIYDASHTLGLILGGQFQNPFKEGADIITANTHKTLAGPQKGLIIIKDKKLGEKMQSKIIGTLYSSNHVANLIALAITILEWEKYGKKYAVDVIKNAQALSAEFEKLGYEVRKANNKTYTKNEQVHLFIKDENKRLEWARNLTKNNISTNLHSSPGKRIFARIGTQEITRRGMKLVDMKTVALLFHEAASGKNIKNKVKKFNSKFKTIKYSFDQDLKI